MQALRNALVYFSVAVMLSLTLAGQPATAEENPPEELAPLPAIKVQGISYEANRPEQSIVAIDNSFVKKGENYRGYIIKDIQSTHILIQDRENKIFRLEPGAFHSSSTQGLLSVDNQKTANKYRQGFETWLNSLKRKSAPKPKTATGPQPSAPTPVPRQISTESASTVPALGSYQRAKDHIAAINATQQKENPE